jgi:hypothetical protein
MIRFVVSHTKSGGLHIQTGKVRRFCLAAPILPVTGIDGARSSSFRLWEHQSHTQHVSGRESGSTGEAPQKETALTKTKSWMVVS